MLYKWKVTLELSFVLGVATAKNMHRNEKKPHITYLEASNKYDPLLVFNFVVFLGLLIVSLDFVFINIIYIISLHI